jgi:hypothetical protein
MSGLTNSMQWNPSWKASMRSTTQKLPANYGTQRLITMFTTTIHWCLNWPKLINCTPSHPISLKSFLLVSSHLFLGLTNALFCSTFLIKILYATLFYLTHITCSTHSPILSDHPKNVTTSKNHNASVTSSQAKIFSSTPYHHSTSAPS